MDVTNLVYDLSKSIPCAAILVNVNGRLFWIADLYHVRSTM